jgi:phosphohistidine phosphatase SixA
MGSGFPRVRLLEQRGPVDAQQAIFVLRHAERVEYESPDGVLSEAGGGACQVLARLLRDAGITAIYTSDRQRTSQTRLLADCWASLRPL